MKTFTYREVTATAEERIIILMAKVAVEKDRFNKNLLRAWAYGVYLGWNDLTFGWQEAGDGDRMRALTEPEQ